MNKELYKDRVSALVDVMGTVLKQWPSIDRDNVIKILEETYKSKGIRPIRGFRAENLYEKEMTSLYLIGKYGLGLAEEHDQLFQLIFYREIKYDEIATALINGNVETGIRDSMNDSDTLSRALRLIFISTLFSFQDEEALFRVIRELGNNANEEIRHVSRSFARFFTAFKIAEAIAERTVRDKVTAEVLEKAIRIRLGADFFYPKREYIALIAREVFGINPKYLRRVLDSDGSELLQKTVYNSGRES
ncbi:hypothetical protein HS7_05820 [Sulfolobales archaeon HS-7]|nr:hypothetical protein HS7_05820 [Sulfolobales archaeon HS-7]